MVGEGTTAEADFHHALTFASIYRAPVILNVVNNQWAISSFQGIAGGDGRDVRVARRIGYGIPALRVDGNDFLAVLAATRWAAERARANRGPTLIEWVTYRAGAALDVRRPVEVPASGRVDGVAARRSDRPAQAAPDRRRGAWSDEQHDAAAGRGRDARCATAAKEAESYGTLLDGRAGVSRGASSRTSSRRCRRTCQRQRQQLEG